MDAQEPSNVLNPSPADVVSLVEHLAEGIWPRSDAERKAWFARVGFESGKSWDDPATGPAVAHYALRTPLSGGEISSSWTSYGGRFLGVNLQLYSSMDIDNPSTREGFDAIREGLMARYGEGTNPWRDPVVQASTWHVNGRRIMIRFFNLQHSGVMVTVEDAGLATASEAEARRRHAAGHWSDASSPSPATQD